jgi:putative ATP-binding cassette transporter
MFSMILSDFHLFDRLYGIENFDMDRLTMLMDKMDLSKKVTFENGSFNNINLSTGQRKRLALVMMLMEDKEIYVLDEWAADQDPQFREYFYRTILPELKEEGKTIIAVTHDEKYFDCADKLILIQEGKILKK